jgi:hypothetical protein
MTRSLVPLLLALLLAAACGSGASPEPTADVGADVAPAPDAAPPLPPDAADDAAPGGTDAATEDTAGGDPSDDPADWSVDPTVEYTVQVSEPRQVVPSAGLPAEVTPQPANNNLDIQRFAGRLFLAWRTAPFHFASAETELLVVSSTDGGETWSFEQRVHLGTDLREPRLLAFGGRLQLLFFEAGTNVAAFEPIRLWRTVRGADGAWGAPEVVVDGYEVPWDVKPRGGAAWMTSYAGEHYGGRDAVVRVFFSRSLDGDRWERVGGAPFVYEGGVSEVAFEFDADGSLWCVTRNEDGDASGWGAHVCHAPADDLAAWDCPERADPNRYDSPELFRHGDDLYLVARRDLGGVFGAEGGDLVAYSLRPKTTALYRIDRQRRAVEHLRDLPGAGDTAFPAVRRTGPHTFLLANYTSPLDAPDISWLQGQAGPTQIYLVTLTFVPAGG